MRLLTIVILTYNRKARLLKQLHSLYSQPEVNEVAIEIVDNHSNYNVYEAIKEEFGEDRISNLSVSVNPMNLGMHANLAMPFFHCKTDWLWTLSDDDETYPDSIRTILSDIEEYPETAVFKYKINTTQSSFNDTIIKSLPELIDFYLDNHVGTGHLIFLSNNVYNYKAAIDNYGSTLSHCFSCIAQMLPMFHILDAQTGIVRMREKRLVNFVRPDPGTGYPYLYTAVEINSTVLFKFNLTNKYYKKFGFLLANDFSHYRLILSALEMEDRKRGRFLYEQIYSRGFKFSGSFIDKLYNMLFYFSYYTHITVISYEKAYKFRQWMRGKKVFKYFR